MNLFYLVCFNILQSLPINNLNEHRASKYELETKNADPKFVFGGSFDRIQPSTNREYLYNKYHKPIIYKPHYRKTKNNFRKPIKKKINQDSYINDDLDVDQMLKIVNDIRSKVGAVPLILNESLMKAASEHSLDQSRTGILSHVGSDGSDVGERLKRQNFNWMFAAENVASGQKSTPEVMNSWIISPGHYDNIINKQARYFGAAVNNLYWTQVFAS